MQTTTAQIAVLLGAAALAACSAMPWPGGPALGIDGIACTGSVAPPPAGLVAQADDALLQEAQAASGDGGICRGRVFVAGPGVRVYRLWDEQRQNTFGQWWTFDPPTGSRDAYRETYAICEEWNALDNMISCTLKPGTRVVVGPGQSAKCPEKTYAKSAANQVFVPNDPAAGNVYVEKCGTRRWP